MFVERVKPIEIGGNRISASGKSVDFPSEESGSSLFWRVGSTIIQITNSAGKKPAASHVTFGDAFCEIAAFHVMPTFLLLFS